MAILMILLIITNSLYILIPIVFALAIFTKGTSPVVQTMFSKIVHQRDYEKIFSIGEIFIAIGSTISAIGMGAIADRFGISRVFYLSSLFAILAIIPVLYVGKTIKSSQVKVVLEDDILR